MTQETHIGKHFCLIFDFYEKLELPLEVLTTSVHVSMFPVLNELYRILFLLDGILTTKTERKLSTYQIY